MAKKYDMLTGKPIKTQKSKKSKKPCPSGFYRNEKGICVQASVGPEYKP